MKKIQYLDPSKKIAVTAPSAGNEKEIDIIRLELAKKKLSERGYEVIETPDVRGGSFGRSADGKQRAAEFMSLIENEDVGLIVSAKGGDYLLEMLPYLDFEKIAASPKWFQGYSDNTGLTLPITTICDMPTVYCNNFNDFAMEEWHESVCTDLSILEGKISEQHSYSMHESSFTDMVTGAESYVLDAPTEIKALDDSWYAEMSGRLLGGCMDVLVCLIGTPFENVKRFVDKYKDDGIIWYLESFALSTERMTLALWQMRQAGWFENAVGFVFGRPCFTSSDYGIEYNDSIKAAIGDMDVPIILGADVGHRAPQMTMINGYLAEITFESGKLTVKYI